MSLSQYVVYGFRYRPADFDNPQRIALLSNSSRLISCDKGLSITSSFRLHKGEQLLRILIV